MERFCKPCFRLVTDDNIYLYAVQIQFCLTKINLSSDVFSCSFMAARTIFARVKTSLCYE